MIESRTFEGLPTGRSAPEPDFAGLGAATRQADADVTIPRDPLDTRGGLGFGGATAESVATGVGVGGLLGQATETAQRPELDVGGQQTGTGLGADVDTGLGIDTGTGSDVTPTGDTDTASVLGQDSGQTPLELLRLDARTTLASRGGAGRDTPALGSGQTIGQPEQGTPPGSPDTPGNPRPPRVPDIPNLPDEEPDEEELLFGEEREDRTFASGLASGEEAAEDAFGDLSFRL
jgi:hypothetical protein